MTDGEKKRIAFFMDGIVVGLDSKMSFVEQVKYITSHTVTICESMNIKVDVDDPDFIKMVKNKVVIEEEKPIVFAKGYTPWLNIKKPTIKWNYYDRYEKYLVKGKEWNWGTVQSINESTDIILDHMQDPTTDKFFGVKGLVMGDIQSGKTANYTALINKALDAQYKFIIVLAGLTKDLRSQTQKRLDKEVLGYETRVDFKKGKQIGVGDYQGEEGFINAITHSGDAGDLNKKSVEAITTVLSNGMQPLIAVIKKNSSVLNALISNFLSSDIGDKTNGKFNVPVLIIDDEVDQASVNTKDTNDISEASRINNLIRTMLQKFNRYAYVGYTATPFANVFINPYGFENDDKDIFPEDFIVCLGRPEKYCGVREYFGIDTIDEDSDNDGLTLDLYKPVNDYFELFDEEVQRTGKIKVDTPVVRINESMKNAFVHFIIASAIKYSRGIIEHNSMLIHIARFKNAASSMRELVKKTLKDMLHVYKYGTDDDRNIYKEYWENEIKPVSKNRLLGEYNDSWENISKNIIPIMEMTINGIKIVNGDSGDIVDYESSDAGQHIIIGGDKLSRGLTLEGLIVSYYYRKTRTYDTLLQMGRWFGYRDGWIDLCRIYTTNSMVNDFINAGIATEMFKEDIEEMNSLQLTPAEFGLKVKYSPRLAPTSASKMRLAVKQRVSFNENLQQTLSYRKEYVEHNRNVTDQFIRSLNNPDIRHSGNIVFKNIDSKSILEYLNNYKECDELVGSVSIKNWINYIKKLNLKNELVDWTVVLHSNSIRKDEYKDEIGGFEIFKNQNTDRNVDADDNRIDLFLKAVTSPSDFKEFYDPSSNEYKTIKSFKAGDEMIRKTFTKEHGLMAIYSVDVYRKIFDQEVELKNGEKRKKYKNGDILKGGRGVIGIGIWFPKTDNIESSAVEFFVNTIYKDNENEDNEND